VNLTSDSGAGRFCKQLGKSAKLLDLAVKFPTGLIRLMNDIADRKPIS
jgi:hypothetical protein